MLALIIKELRRYARQTKYRRIQVIMIGLLALVLFSTAFEQFTLSSKQPHIDVGERTYAVLVPVFFCLLLGLVVPLQAVESFQIEDQSSSWYLFVLTPIGHRKFLIGKLMALLITATWCIWLAMPIFWLSSYTGGLLLSQLFQCGAVFIATFVFFSLIGIVVTLSNPRVTVAISRSYAVVLLITFVPLLTQFLAPIPAFPATVLDLLRILSPLCVLIAVVKSDAEISLGIAPIWVWMVFCYTLLSAMLFWVSCKQLVKHG